VLAVGVEDGYKGVAPDLVQELAEVFGVGALAADLLLVGAAGTLELTGKPCTLITLIRSGAVGALRDTAFLFSSYIYPCQRATLRVRRLLLLVYISIYSSAPATLWVRRFLFLTYASPPGALR
jgi:hypothetical protein